MTNIVSSMNALESQINDKKKELSDLEDEIESGDLLYIEDSFRWGKGSIYAAFSLPFFIT